MNLQLNAAGGVFTPRDIALCCLPIGLLFASILSLM